MKRGYSVLLHLFFCSAASITAHAQPLHRPRQRPYLLAGSPNDLSISQFRRGTLTARIPDLCCRLLDFGTPLRIAAIGGDLTRASKINENLLIALHGVGARYAQSEKYADYTAAHSGAGTKAAKAKALEYMKAAIIRTVAPLLTKEQSQKKLQKDNLSPVKVNTITPRRRRGTLCCHQITAKGADAFAVETD